MSYKIESLKVRNFKCFDKKKFYEFYFLQDANPTILSGPNGFGKTTFFDAIELIFTKRITRLNSEIEDGRTNLGKNILLNTSDECGYLILSLIDSTKKKLTIITEIDNNLTKLTIDTAIKFTYVEGTIDTNKFDDFLMKSIKWEADISAFDNINYIKEHFNVYYYISQAESVHFLKNNIATRKDSMTKLLQTEVIQEKINKIEHNLIGATKAKKGVIINDEIKVVKTELDKKIYDLKNILEHGVEVYKEVNYNSLLVYPQQCEMKKWDIEKLELRNVSEKQVSEYIAEINNIYNLYQDLSDYKKFLKNKEIESLINNDEALLNYTKYSMFIKNNIFDFKQIEEEVIRLNRLLDVFKYSTFFRSKLDISKYKKEDIVLLQKEGLVPEIVVVDDLDRYVSEIKVLYSQLGEKEKKKNELLQAREKLHLVRKNNVFANHCPYCNAPYDNPELLEAAYNALSSQLKSLQDNISMEIETKSKTLSDYVKPIVDSIGRLFGQKDYEEIESIRATASEYSRFLKSEKRIDEIIKIHGFIGENNSWKELDEASKIIELKRIIETNLSAYENKNFLENLKIFNYDDVFKENALILSIEQPNLKDKISVDNKIMFINYQNSLMKNEEINLMKNDVKILITKLKKLEKIRKNFDDLKIQYNKAINESMLTT